MSANWPHLDDIFAPDGFAAFRAGAWRKAPLHLTGEPGRFARLFDWDALSRMLETTPLEAPRIELCRGGRSLPEDTFIRRHEGVARIDGGALTRLLDQGATMIVNFFDELAPGPSRCAPRWRRRWGCEPRPISMPAGGPRTGSRYTGTITAC